ncbi:alpha/beta-hydrolase [Calocera viscosa TUFC12733]|uniref:Alpha/beta-hydrolase n=1 Tax=Calocera viscosa (strain TUFC12733) TaxID=1330018 RepID=A0A167S8D4_CALVF|nr:alpha/beta-hydrolase [Calocera viscosa TUFC12733]
MLANKPLLASLELSLLCASVLAAPASFLDAELFSFSFFSWFSSAPSTFSELEPAVLEIPAFSNPAAAEFHVNSSALPLVDFELLDSYAGLLPISADDGEEKKLFFWYWPTSAPEGSEYLTIWLNGGPGCSSLMGFLQENGPLLYLPGMEKPQPNPDGWTTASDMLFIDQPIGTGFSVGPASVRNEEDIADQFYSFLQQFYAVFPELLAKPLIFSGESYAGYYIPFIADRIVNASPAEKDMQPIQVHSLLMNDGCYSSGIVMQHAPTPAFARLHQQTLNLSDAQILELETRRAQCGYDTLLAQLTYPPRGPLTLPNGKDYTPYECDLTDLFKQWCREANPCFREEKVTDASRCPSSRLEDPLDTYFNRADVQSLLHLPPIAWSECTSHSVYENGADETTRYSEVLLPSLLDALPGGVTLWHGLLDGLLLAEGDRLTIQNLTWGGVQGFAQEPSTPLSVGGERKGVWHEERGLTYVEVEGAGHMVPQDQPAVALRVLRYVMGLETL